MLENRIITPEKLVKVANRILHPYTIEVKDVGWWSVYEIGQRLCDRFDDVPTSKAATRLPRVFIAGDASYPQRQGGSGNERVNGGRLESGVEAGLGH